MRLKVADLIPGTQYGVQVRAVREGQTSQWSERFVFTTDQNLALPKAPQNVTWIVSGDSFVGTWSPVTEDELNEPIVVTAYELELNAGGIIKYVTVVPKTDTDLTYTLTFAENVGLFGTAKPSIAFRVRAVNNKAVKGYWSVATTATNAPPSPVTNLVSTGLPDAIELSWDGVTDEDLDRYEVYVGTASTFVPGPANRVWAGLGTRMLYGTSTYSDHYLKVLTFDKFGQPSTEVVTGPVQPLSPFVTDTIAPDTPTSLAATITNNATGVGARAAVSWTLTTVPSDLAGFYIRFRKVGDINWTVNTFTADDRAGNIELQSAYTNYEFQIKSFDWQSNESAWSATVTATSPVNAAPPAVSGLTSTPARDGIRYDWTALTTADLKDYEVTFSTSPTFAAGNTTFYTASNTLTVGGLQPSTTYYARIRARDTANKVSASWSATDTKTTLSSSASTSVSDLTSGEFADIDMIMGLNSRLILNGGYIKSNTYTGTSQASNPSNNGFYLGNDGLRIDDGIVSAKALKTGVISGTQTIELSGASAVIQSQGYNGTAGFKLSGSGLEIPDGTLAASKLLIQQGQNLMPARLADFEAFPDSYVLGVDLNTGGTAAGAVSVVAGESKFNSQCLKMQKIETGAGTYTSYFLAGGASQYNIPVEEGKTYIFSGYFRTPTTEPTGTETRWVVRRNDATASYVGNQWTTPNDGLWHRYYAETTIPTGVTEIAVEIRSFRVGVQYADGIQVEEKMSGLSTPSRWTPPGLTRIDAGIIRTGELRSTNTLSNGQPSWSINFNGAASFSQMQILGNTVLGSAATDTLSRIQSYNYVPGSAGWMIRGDGDAEFSTAALRGSLTVGQITNLQDTLNNVEHFYDDGSFADLWTTNNGNVATQFNGIVNAQSGGTIMRYIGLAAAARREDLLIPFDPDLLYRVTVRVRLENGAVPADNKFYAGLAGVAADGVTMVNRDGVNSYGGQHHIAAQAEVLTSDWEWHTFVGYVKGHVDVGVQGDDAPHPNVTQPAKLHADVRYIRPEMYTNYPTGPAITDIDMFKIESMRPVDAVQAMWGDASDVTRIDGGNIQTDTVTLDTLKAGNLEKQITLADGAILVAEGNMGETVGFGSEGFKVVGPNEANITAATRTTTTVTLTTSKNHGYAVGSQIYVEGLDNGTSNYDGMFTVATVPALNKVTYAKSGVAHTASSTSGAILYGLDTENPISVREPQPIYVEFPTTIAKPNIISGTLQASVLTVSSGATFRGVVGIEVGSVFNIASAVLAPKAAPTVTANYDKVAINGLSSGAVVRGMAKGHNGNLFVLSTHDTKAGNVHITEHTATGGFVAERATWGSVVYNEYSVSYGLVYYNNNYYTIDVQEGSGTRILRFNTSFVQQQLLELTNTWFGSPALGWNHTANKLIYSFIETTGAFDTEGGALVVREYAIDATSGAIGTPDADVTMTGVGDNINTLSFVARGTFGYAASDRYVFKTIGNVDKTWEQNFIVTNTTGGLLSSEYWPAADSSNVWAGYYDPATQEFFDVDGAKNRRRYVGGDSFWTTGQATRWIGFTYYKTAGAETNLSPRRQFELPKRAQMAVTISPIPGGVNASYVPDSARVYIANVANDPGATSTSWHLRNTVAYPSTTAKVNPYQALTGAGPPATNGFGLSANPGSIQSTSGQSFWKGDDTAQFKSVVLIADTEAGTGAGNNPPLRIGNINSAHLRVDSNEIIAMVSDNSRAGGTLVLSSDTVRFNVVGGGADIVGGANYAAKLRTTNDNYTALVLDFNVMGATNATFGGGSYSSTNTVNFHAKEFHAWGGGLFDETETGKGNTGANYNDFGRVVRSSSSKRYKKNIKTLEPSEAYKALALRAVSFKWRKDRHMGDRTQAGFIAEEAHDADMALWVTYDEKGRPDGVRYAELTAAHNVVLSCHEEAIKELREDNADLNTRLAELEAAVALLTARS